MRATREACPEYAWCDGHDVGDSAESCNEHMTDLPAKSDGESSLKLGVFVSPGLGLQFDINVDYWIVPGDDIEGDFAKFRALLDKLEQQAKEFKFKHPTVRPEVSAGTLSEES